MCEAALSGRFFFLPEVISPFFLTFLTFLTFLAVCHRRDLRRRGKNETWWTGSGLCRSIVPVESVYCSNSASISGVSQSSDFAIGEEKPRCQLLGPLQKSCHLVPRRIE